MCYTARLIVKLVDFALTVTVSKGIKVDSTSPETFRRAQSMQGKTAGMPEGGSPEQQLRRGRERGIPASRERLLLKEQTHLIQSHSAAVRLKEQADEHSHITAVKDEIYF